MKTGRISKSEGRQIATMLDSMTADDIAKKLDRNPDSVHNYIKRELNVGITNEEEAAFSLDLSKKTEPQKIFGVRSKVE